ncbi:MAG TPA: DUF2452 domain-containing protein [Chitinophagaceae bacterium]|nr:DUF2452 domain-containing protein [Chitinophagaceae bacterium]
MVQAYNFLASWQLFPEKGDYDQGERPLSGNYRMETTDRNGELVISHTWVNLENQGFSARYTIRPDGDLHPFDQPELAEAARGLFPDARTFEIQFYRGEEVVLTVRHEIQPNGYLKITQQGKRGDGGIYSITEIYHKQLSVLPYASSLGGPVIRPTEEGVIRHKALAALEEQTDRQLELIRRQVELLALQAQEIHRRKELSRMIYQARIPFQPQIGQVYYLYGKADGTCLLSLVSPREWGGSLPFDRFIAAVRLLADHTWEEQ